MISSIFDQDDSIYKIVAQDLGEAEHETGANRITVEQTVRSAIIKQMEGFSYEELAFHHLEDSKAYRTFCRLGFGGHYAKATLNTNIKAVSESAWEQVNFRLVKYAEQEGIEKVVKFALIVQWLSPTFTIPTILSCCGILSE